MPDDSSDSPESNSFDNPFEADRAEDIEYLALVDDIDDQYNDFEVGKDRSPEPQPLSSMAPPKPAIAFPQRFVLWAIVCATVPTCILAGFAYQINLKSVREVSQRNQELRAIALADSINNIVLRQYENTKKLSQGLGLTAGLQANKKPSDRQKNLITNRLNAYVKESKVIDNVGIYNVQGNLILRSDLGKSSSTIDRVLLQKVTKFNSPIINPTYLDKSGVKGNEYVIQFIVPVSDLKTKKIQAIVKSQIPIKYINSYFTIGDYLVTDINKKVLLNTFDGTSNSSQLDTTNSNNQLQLLTVPTRSLQGLPDLKWYISVPPEYSLNNNYPLILGTLILVSIAAIALITYFAARQFSYRLIQISNAIYVITETGSTKQLSTQGNDEVAQLSAHVNLMTSKSQSVLDRQNHTIDQLQTLIAKGVAALHAVIKTNGEYSKSSDIEAIAAHLQASLVKKQTEINLLNREQERLYLQISQKEHEVNNLNLQNLEQTNQMIVQIEKSTEELKISTEQYKIVLQEIGEQAEQKQEELVEKNLYISDLELQLAQLVEKMGAITKQLSETLIDRSEIEGKYEVSNQNTELMAKQIMHLREAIAISSKKAKRLSESSQKISKVVDLIHEIGVEANFLAVNAGIKANREHSSDFSVFSDQVDKLANMAIAAMKEMEQLAVNIQTETREVMGNLETGASQISEATKLIAGVKGDLQNAEEMIKRKAESESKLYAALGLMSRVD